jgi:hypothetical protein
MATGAPPMCWPSHATPAGGGDDRSEATIRRSIFVMRTGLRPVAVIPARRRRPPEAEAVGGE